MGDFMGHVLPGTLLLAVGLWRVWASVARYAAHPPAAFRVRAWNPVPAPGPARLLELHVVAGGAFLDMCVELVYASPLRVVLTGGDGVGVDVDHAAVRLGGLEHAGMLLMFFLFGALALVSEKTRYLPLPDGALSLVFGSAFTAEFLLFRFHSTTHAGLEGYYHGLLLFLLGLCIAAVVAGALLPSSFPADLGAGVLIAVQGMWFYQTGLTLYGPMLPAGCVRRFDDSPHHSSNGARIECHGQGGGAAALERAEQLADFQLFGIVFLAFVYVLGCFAVAAARYGNKLAMTTTAHHERRHVAATAMDEECTI